VPVLPLRGNSLQRKGEEVLTPLSLLQTESEGEGKWTTARLFCFEEEEKANHRRRKGGRGGAFYLSFSSARGRGRKGKGTSENASLTFIDPRKKEENIAEKGEKLYLLLQGEKGKGRGHRGGKGRS